MTESRIYLNFFRRNFLIILVPTLIVLLVTCYFLSTLPTRTYQSVLMVTSHDDRNVEQQMVLTEQAVSQLRAPQLARAVGLAEESQLQVVKTGPLSININVEHPDPAVSFTQANSVVKYVSTHFPLSQQGEIIPISEPPKSYLYLLIGTCIGLLTGVFMSLIREYFRNY